MENVITLGKLIGLLFLFCSRNDLARPVMGTIFLVELISKGVVRNKCIYIYVCRYVCLVLKCVGGITYAHAQCQFWAVKTDL